MIENNIRVLIKHHATELYEGDKETQIYLTKRANELLDSLLDDFPFSRKKNPVTIAVALIYFAHIDLAKVKISQMKKPSSYDRLIEKQENKIQRTIERLETQKKKLEELKHKKSNLSVTIPKYDYWNQEKASKISGVSPPTFSSYVRIMDKKLDILKVLPGMPLRRKRYQERRQKWDLYDKTLKENREEFFDLFADKGPVLESEFDKWLLIKGVDIRKVSPPHHMGIIYEFLNRPKIQYHVSRHRPRGILAWDEEPAWIITRESLDQRLVNKKD